MTALPLPLFDDPARPAPSIRLPAGLPEGPRPGAAGVSSRAYPGASRPGGFSAEDIAALLRRRSAILLASPCLAERVVASLLLAGGKVMIDPAYARQGPWPGISIRLVQQIRAIHSRPDVVARMCGESP